MGLEGIVLKRQSTIYRSGPTHDCIIPAGTLDTIVHDKDGEAYVVEFEDAFEVPETIAAGKLIKARRFGDE